MTEDGLAGDFWRALLGLVLTSLVVMGSPGPATMSVTTVGAAFGFRRSIGYLGGIVLGTSGVLLAVAAGVVTILLSVPRLAPVLIFASAGYMLYLAYKIATAPPLSRRDGSARAPSLAEGFLLAIANPKAYVAITAVFAGTALGLRSAMLEATLKTATLVVMIVLIHVAWLLAGTAFARLLSQPRASRIANIVFAIILVATTAIAVLH
jgi:threonine/homoserine/homoserine lactone efflux protein